MNTAHQKQTHSASTLDAEEVARFTAIAEEWWDPKGKFAPLHRLNPARLEYIRDVAVGHFGVAKSDAAAAAENAASHLPGQGPAHASIVAGIGQPVGCGALAPLKNITILDIGCGGGLVAEPLARMGATVLGIDAGEKNVKTAQAHAAQTGVAVEYRVATAEGLVNEGGLAPPTPSATPAGSAAAHLRGEVSPIKQYDVVLALEIIEHVANVPLFLESCARLMKPGGLLMVSTLNRTAKAYALAVIGAEYVLRWLPRGTHDWKKFLKPHEIVQPLQGHGLTLKEMRGLVFNPLTGQWQISERDIEVNYMVAMRKEHCVSVV